MDASRGRRGSEPEHSSSPAMAADFPRQSSINSISASPASSAVSTPRSTKVDSNLYATGQSLASVLNNPKLGKSGIYGNESNWSWMFSNGSDNAQDLPPPLAPGILPEVSIVDFEPYLSKNSAACSRFIDVREHATWEQTSAGVISGSAPSGGGEDAEARGQGEGLLACLREIPPLYFDEDFALENGATFQAACPFTTIQANMMLQEKLSHYLDLVEVHLVKEISSRSDSFFEALGQLEELNGRIVVACNQIRHLQSTVSLLDKDIVDAARRIHLANMRRNNLLALHQKLKLLSYVNHALQTLRLLVASADCAAALDVIDDMRQLLESDDLVGLHCFRHLGDQLNQAAESVNGMLMADFVREAIHLTTDLEPNHILGAFHARKKLGRMPAKELVLLEVNKAESYEDEDVKDGLREQLLPIVVGLLRTSKLPAVLRAYRETLITDIKAAIKCVVGELLPVLFTGPIEGDAPPDADGGQSLANKLKGLSAEDFVQLLLAVFVTIQSRLRRAAEVRSVIEQIIGGLQGGYAADAVTAAFVSGAAQAAADEEAQQGAKSKALSAPGGIELTSGTTAVMIASNTSKQFRADVLRENTEAVCAACDAAHGRWTKLLGVRAVIHPKLKLHEFVAIHDITSDFISATETVGGRLGYSIRGTLQSQSKSFVDAQHSSRLSNIASHLDQETWVAVDATDESQAIVDSLTTDSAFELTNSGTFSGDELPIEAEMSTGVDLTPLPKVANGLQPPANGSIEREAGKTSQTVESRTSGPVLESSQAVLANARTHANGEAGNEPAARVEESSGGMGGDSAQLAPQSGAENGIGDVRTGAENSASTAVENMPKEEHDQKVAGTSDEPVSTTSEHRNQEILQQAVPDGRSSEASSESTQAHVPPPRGVTAVEQALPSQGASGAGRAHLPAVAGLAESQVKPKVLKSSLKRLQVHGQYYHVVSSALMMLKMVADYLDVANVLPAMATEVVHRMAEILKLFNTRTCQLVLGAGAMQVSGLKSITAKHLALSSQCISVFYALIGDIRRSLSVHIPDARKGLLLMEIDRVAQDYRVHRDEVHSKLVAIMRERLLVHLRSLPAMADGWNKPDEGDQLPSQFARALTKEVGVLHRVLSPLLLESDLRSIFSRVVELFHVQLADSFSKVEVLTPQSKRRLYRDIQLVLQCLRALPAAPLADESKGRELDQLLLLRFGTEAPP